MQKMNYLIATPGVLTAGGRVLSERKPDRGWVPGLALVAALSLNLQAENIPVPNGSFELPVTEFVEVSIESWEKTPKPDWYDESGGFYWVQLTGLFRNEPVDHPDHIINCDGDQAIWLFAVPEVGLFQESSPSDPGDPEGTEVLQAVFEPGTAYQLTVGVIGGGGGMLPGATLEIGLYYRDADGDQVTVGATTVTHDPEMFGEVKQFLDFTAHVPTVDADDAWAGQHLGISFRSTAGLEFQGGFWRLDNVRLSGSSAPRLVEVAAAEGVFGFAVESQPGVSLEIFSTTDVTAPFEQWISEGTVMTGESGRAEFSTNATDAVSRFYRARLVP
jgi:hypothetical protein